MKFSLLCAVSVLACSSCEKARKLFEKNEKKPPTPTTSAPAASTQAHTGTTVSEISESDFESFSQQTGKVLIVDFYADWCGPCRKLGPILDQVASSHNGLVLVGKVNVDKSQALAEKEGVQGIPDVRIFRDGKQVDRFVGLPPEADVRRRVEEQLKGLTPQTAEPIEATKPKPAAPLTQPMTKDWMPDGMKRR